MRESSWNDVRREIKRRPTSFVVSVILGELALQPPNTPPNKDQTRPFLEACLGAPRQSSKRITAPGMLPDINLLVGYYEVPHTFAEVEEKNISSRHSE